ncbi:hypothetical protein MPDQ_007759 [Monascus purpureus]|uniref:Uncharacterized protein n=1 Tax=Monascus purpureus TaxID=5098 RepID=A0A507QT71_MONPU|nr:hypothetical protein MPDQ_007759 [Monascus purpureus]
MATDDPEKRALGREASIGFGEVDYANHNDANLQTNGHRTEISRQFNWISALGFGFSITNSWVGCLTKSNFGQNLVYGGPQVVVFGLLVAFVIQFIITAGLGELASAFPR